MNLWAKSLGRLSFAVVALFFFSCEDEASILGRRNPAPKFDVSYIELPLSSSVVLLDSFRTNNFSNEVGRWLVGSYDDEEFGAIRATGYSTFFTTSADTIPSDATLDSVTMELQFDFYTYGNQTQSVQSISVHELTEQLDSSKIFNKAATAYDPTPLGSKTFSIDPAAFKEYASEGDTTISISMPLSKAFGDRIFDVALDYTTSKKEDTVFITFERFRELFRGVAIVASSTDKIVGFRPNASRITLHYQTPKADSLRRILAFVGRSYSQIERDGASTSLAGLTSYHEDFFPADDRRFIQAGTGIVTKIDLSNFYSLIDADSNANMMINEAELIIDPIESPAGYDPITFMYLYAMDEDSRLRRTRTAKDTTLVLSYNTFLAVSDQLDLLMVPVGEGALFELRKVTDENRYRGFLTRFAQQMAIKTDPNQRMHAFALYPASPNGNKSLNRIVFPAEGLKLRIYYTRSKVTQPND